MVTIIIHFQQSFIRTTFNIWVLPGTGTGIGFGGGLGASFGTINDECERVGLFVQVVVDPLTDN